MELKNFIKEVVASIHDATNELIKEIEEKPGTGAVNPTYRNTDRQNRIDFDVAVNVSEAVSGSDNKDYSGKLQVISSIIQGGCKSSKDVSFSSHSVSRVKFSIPLRLPHAIDREAM